MSEKTPASKVSGPPSWVRKLNEEFGLVIIGQSTVIACFKNDGRVDFISMSTFETLLANRTVKLRSGKPIRGKQLVQAWLASPDRREYRDGTTFDPSDAASDKQLNLWSGFGVEEAFGNARPVLDFIYDVICDRKLDRFQYVLAWMAQLVQQPHKKPGTALVLIGPQGTGKSTFGEILIQMIGRRHAMSVNSIKSLTRDFNSHLRDKCLVVVEEGKVTAADANVMKDLITNDYITIEQKYVDKVPMRNHLHLVICSNEANAIFAQAGERRYAMLPVSERHREDYAYFDRLYKSLDPEAVGSLLRILRAWDYSSINLRRVPRTELLLENKVQSMNLVERFLYNALHTGEILPGHPWQKPIEVHALLQEVNDSAQSHYEHVNEMQLGIQLVQLLPGLRKRRPAGPRRARMYEFPALPAARQAFEKRLGQPINWDWAPDQAAYVSAAGGVVQHVQGSQSASPQFLSMAYSFKMKMDTLDTLDWALVQVQLASPRTS